MITVLLVLETMQRFPIGDLVYETFIKHLNNGVQYLKIYVSPNTEKKQKKNVFFIQKELTTYRQNNQRIMVCCCSLYDCFAPPPIRISSYIRLRCSSFTSHHNRICYWRSISSHWPLTAALQNGHTVPVRDVLNCTGICDQ